MHPSDSWICRVLSQRVNHGQPCIRYRHVVQAQGDNLAHLEDDGDTFDYSSPLPQLNRNQCSHQLLLYEPRAIPTLYLNPKAAKRSKPPLLLQGSVGIGLSVSSSPTSAHKTRRKQKICPSRPCVSSNERVLSVGILGKANLTLWMSEVQSQKTKGALRRGRMRLVLDLVGCYLLPSQREASLPPCSCWCFEVLSSDVIMNGGVASSHAPAYT